MNMPLPSALPSGPQPAELLTIGWQESIGLCVQALMDSAAGTVLDHFTGDLSAEIRQHSLQVTPDLHISNTRFIGFLSHSCDPNGRLDMQTFELVALRDIAAGEIVTIDYAHTEDRLFKQFACVCGADNCRHWITGRLEEASEDGKLYLTEIGKLSAGL